MTGPWTCPTDEQWTRFVLDPQLAEREQLARHLPECEFCRLRVNDLARELDELAAEWHATAPSSVIFFTPIGGTGAERVAEMLLAADSGEQVSPAESATLASVGQEMFLRVVRDQRTGEIWLYVIADDPSRYANVIVKSFGRDEEHVTDGQGRVNLGAADWPAPDLLTAEVRLPKAAFIMTPLAGAVEPADSVVLKSPVGDQIRVTFSGTGRNRRLEIHLIKTAEMAADIPLRIGIRQATGMGVLQVQPVVSEKAQFEQVNVEGAIEIYLYQ